jgi:hypothetical protein
MSLTGNTTALCIDDSIGSTNGCDSWLHAVESSGDVRENFSIQSVYRVDPGSNIFYLKGYRNAEATSGLIRWDDFVVMYFPTEYDLPP